VLARSSWHLTSRQASRQPSAFGHSDGHAVKKNSRLNPLGSQPLLSSLWTSFSPFKSPASCPAQSSWAHLLPIRKFQIVLSFPLLKNTKKTTQPHPNQYKPQQPTPPQPPNTNPKYNQKTQTPPKHGWTAPASFSKTAIILLPCIMEGPPPGFFLRC